MIPCQLLSYTSYSQTSVFCKTSTSLNEPIKYIPAEDEGRALNFIILISHISVKQLPDVSLAGQSGLPVTHVVVPHAPEPRHGHLMDHVVGVPETSYLE